MEAVNLQQNLIKKELQEDYSIFRNRKSKNSLILLIISILTIYIFGQKVVAKEQEFIGRDYVDVRLSNIINLNSLIEGAILSKNEKELLYWNDKGVIKVLNLENNRQKIKLNHQEHIKGAMFSKDEKKILSWSKHTVKLWDIMDYKPLNIFTPTVTVDKDMIPIMEKKDLARYYWIIGAKFNKKGNKILIWTKMDVIKREGYVKVWDMKKNKYLFRFKHSRWISEVNFNKDESELVIAGDHRGVTLWDVKKQKLLKTFYHTHREPMANLYEYIHGVKFSKDEKFILTEGNDGTSRLINKKTGKEKFIATHDDSSIFGSNFNKNNDKVISWSNDGIRLWSIADKSEISYLEHKDVIGVKFTKN